VIHVVSRYLDSAELVFHEGGGRFHFSGMTGVRECVPRVSRCEQREVLDEVV